ncbi:hypothetical protein N7486_001085 [Penicillium sp. IBT 16267x]|nr:hypothetical protein N7486_001085 [Penicillium sp. IBT 16267x]
MKLGTAIARGFQLIFSIVVLGLSITIARQQYYGSVPSQTGYAAFTGALGVLVSLVGIAALFVDSLSGIIIWVLDGVAGVALLAAGIVYAVTLKGTDCSDPNNGTTWDNPLISGGCTGKGNDRLCHDGSWGSDEWSTVKSRCKRAEADCAFMFLAFIASVAVLIASFLSRNLAPPPAPSQESANAITLTELAFEGLKNRDTASETATKLSDALWEAIGLEDVLEGEVKKRSDIEREIRRHPGGGGLPKLVLRRNTVHEVEKAVKAQAFVAFCELSQGDKSLFWELQAERARRLC